MRHEHTLERTTKVHLVSPLRQAFGVNENSCMAAEKTLQLQPAIIMQLDLASEEAERNKIMIMSDLLSVPNNDFVTALIITFTWMSAS
mmetsp:Transcript_33338/g.56501  ORF Transcript_33338/g.56501 Transcript_33338/m.56501 type:complete len:88 (+) Transcript_33338:262-525(+)